MISIPDPRPAIGFRRWLHAASLALLCLGLLQVTAVQAAPIPTTTIGFTTASGAVGGYYNGGTDGAGNSGPNVGIVVNTANPAGGGALNGLINPIFSVPNGFTGEFAVEAINVAVGFAINVYDGENGTGTLLASQGFTLNGNTTGSVSFSGTAKSVVLARWSGNPFYDNLTFGSITVGTPVVEAPGVATSAATSVGSATATLNGSVNPGGVATTAQFEYGTSPSYGSTANVTLSPNDGTGGQVVSTALTGLTPSTTYHFRLTAVNSAGTQSGSELTFTTAAPPATALHFDGVNDSVDIPHSAGQLGYPFTVEAWVKTTDADGILVSKYVGSSGNGWQMGMGGGKLTAWFFRPGGAGAIFPTGAGIVGATTINNGAWHHVAFVVDSTGGRLYVDGVADGSSGWTWGTPGPATTTVPVRLGNETTGYLYPFAGTLDEVRIWAVARSAAELQTYKTTELAVMPPCLMGYYKLNHGTVGGNNAGVTTAVDATGGASGTLNNFALTGPTSNWTGGSGITQTASAFSPSVPDINVEGGSPLVTIPDGTTATGTANGTDFGSSLVGTGVPQTFTLENTGTSDLTVSALSFSGANPADYAVSGIILPATVAANDSTMFRVTFNPSAGGSRTATLNVVSDDCDEGNYDFALIGTGTVNNPPTVVAADGTVTVNEGTTAFNGITFSDPEGNSVTLTASLGTVSAGAGTSAFAGSDLTTAGQWRTASVVKPKDPDGDNVYGTDGYAIWGLDGVETVVNPAYATITRNPALIFYPGNPGYQNIDDPTNPAGPQKVTGAISSPNPPGSTDPTDFYTLTFTQARLVRMGVLVDNSTEPALSPATLRLRQTAGGTYDSGYFAAGDGTSRNKTVDYYFFDIAAQAGDVFVISGNNDPGYFGNGVAGMFLDTAGWNYATLDGPAGPTTVTITATDSLGAAGTTTFTLNVNNVAPTATFSRSAATANENTVTPPSVSFTGQTDPGTTDVSTGFKYSYDYNNDGTWDDGDGTHAGSLTAATKTIPASYFASPTPSPLVVKGRILDKDGGSTDYTVSITINRTPNDLALNPSSLAENNAPNATVGMLSATDPDVGNTHTFALVGGTGSGDNGSFTIAGSALRLTPSANFEVKNSYALRVRAVDAGGLFFEKALTVMITDVFENLPPVAPAQTFVRAPGLTLKIKIADVLAACSDSDGGTLGLQSVGASAQGATIVRTATHLLYTQVADANDSFSYTITDGQGGSTTGTITVSVVNPGGLVQSLTPAVGAVTVNFAGIPGFTYDIQRATSPAGPWTTVATSTAPANGLFSYTDPSPPQPTAFYRLRQTIAP